QRALAAEPWGALGSLSVRMAIHTGTADAHGGDYVGPPLNRVARLLATGHGGQVLLSQATQHLVSQHLPEGASLRDLGRHRLRDLLEPEHVFQLVAPDLPNHFPPLQSLERHPTNLPIQPTPLVGRETVLAEVEALLARDDVRLVTLTGMGGTGKTRLALQVAAETLVMFADGAYLVDLAPVADPGLVLSTIATTLGLREAGGQSLRDTLVAYLAEKRLLIVLDNFEQILAAAPVVADLLASCEHLKVLVTSRARLGLRAEHEYLVPPLATPNPMRLPPLSELAAIDSVALFVERAGAARHNFVLTAENAPAVAAICARLDGLPLAIELAAARVKTLPPKAILERLSSRLKLLTGGARDLPERQRTLRATIAWSHGLLPVDEQTLFRRLAVFAGGFSLESAETVVSAMGAFEIDVLDGITTLVEQSLLRQEDGSDGEARFTMLETLREFGQEQLTEAGEVVAARQAHTAWCLALAEEAVPRLTGPEQGTWLARLEMEHDNLRAALATSLTDQRDTHLQLAGVLWRFWYMRGYLSEGRRWLEQALADDTEIAATTAARANVLNGAGGLAYAQGDLDHARIRFEQSLAIRRTLNDKAGIAASLNNVGIVADEQGDYAKAAALYGESLALERELGDSRGAAISLNNLGLVVEGQGDYARAGALYTESLGIVRELGDQRAVAFSLHNLGNLAYTQGDYARAVELHTETLRIHRTLGDERGAALSLNYLGRLAAEQGDHARAAELHVESLEILQAFGDKRSLIEGLDGVAALAVGTMRARQALRLFGAAAALRETLGVPATAIERTRNERTLTKAKAQLGESVLAEIQASGRALSVEQAVAEALTVAREVSSASSAGLMAGSVGTGRV
ncbi:MAG: tetratricopeptide repeat protein, partial [Chloroflexota bacterium]|nr:tetratricopeptide repeat protein [Chloroflexota bacterium]